MGRVLWASCPLRPWAPLQSAASPQLPTPPPTCGQYLGQSWGGVWPYSHLVPGSCREGDHALAEAAAQPALTERGGVEGAWSAQRVFVQGLSVPRGCLRRKELSRTAWFQGGGWMKPYILLCCGVERLLLGEMGCPASWRRFSEKPQPLSSLGLPGSFSTSFLIPLLSSPPRPPQADLGLQRISYTSCLPTPPRC